MEIKGPLLAKEGPCLWTLREVAIAHGRGVPFEELSRRSGLAPDTLRFVMLGDFFKAISAGAALGS